MVDQWSPLAASVILVWEHSAGKLWAVNGRYRTDWAKRRGVSAIAAQIVRAKDGVTAQQARTMGAELNTLEGQGSIEHYARSFRNPTVSGQEGRQRALLGRAKG